MFIITEETGYTFPGGSEIPPITKFAPSAAKHLPMAQFLAYLFPRDVPQKVLDTFTPVFNKVVDSPAFGKFIASQGATKWGLSGKKADEVVMGMEQRFSWFAQDMGTAKVNPEKLGIKRP